MKLTGKCKEAFLLFFNTHRRGAEDGFYELPELFQNALIIEFFDSVGIWNKIFLECFENGLGNYKEATNAAIEKANEIFNLNKKIV